MVYPVAPGMAVHVKMASPFSAVALKPIGTDNKEACGVAWASFELAPGPVELTPSTT